MSCTLFLDTLKDDVKHFFYILYFLIYLIFYFNFYFYFFFLFLKKIYRGKIVFCFSILKKIDFGNDKLSLAKFLSMTVKLFLEEKNDLDEEDLKKYAHLALNLACFSHKLIRVFFFCLFFFFSFLNFFFFICKEIELPKNDIKEKFSVIQLHKNILTNLIELTQHFEMIE